MAAKKTAETTTKATKKPCSTTTTTRKKSVPAKKKAEKTPLELKVEKISKLTEDELAEVVDFVANGATRKDILRKYELKISQIKPVMDQCPEFRRAIEEGQSIQNDIVEMALYKTATGYETEDVIERYAPNEFGEMELKFVIKTKRFVQPNTKAQTFWLTNKVPDRFADKRQIEAVVNYSDILERAKQRVGMLDNVIDVTPKE